MRVLALMMLMVVGCGEVENGAYKHRPKPADKNESTPTTNTNELNDAKAERAALIDAVKKLEADLDEIKGPVKTLKTELTAEEEKVVGTYEDKRDIATEKWVFLADGISEYYINDIKLAEFKWEIAEGELHAVGGDGGTAVFRINKDSSITGIARIVGEKRTDAPKDKQITYQKIK